VKLYDRKIIRFPGDVIERNIKGCRNSLDRRERPDNLIFSCDGGTGYVLDYSTMRQREATTQDIGDFCRLADALENVDKISFPVFDKSVPYEIQDLTIFRQVWGNTGKCGGGLSRNGGVWMNTSPALPAAYRSFR
jgi:trimethylamine:corrinoid methyltransferase-like protein